MLQQLDNCVYELQPKHDFKIPELQLRAMRRGINDGKLVLFKCACALISQIYRPVEFI